MLRWCKQMVADLQICYAIAYQLTLICHIPSRNLYQYATSAENQ